MVELMSKKQGAYLKLFTRIEEITPEVLNEIYKDLNLPSNYCIISLLQKVKLSQISLLTASKAKETVVYTVPVIGKLPEKYNYDGKINIGDKAIIARSSIELSTHLYMNISSTLENIFNFINSDTELKAACYQNKIKDDKENEDVWVYVIESKIIPISDIRATTCISNINRDIFRQDIPASSCSSNS